MADSSEQRSVSRRELIKRGFGSGLLSLTPLGAILDRHTASADNIRLIDFAERRIAPDQIRSAGYAGVVNYVSEARPGADFEAKPLTREYADALRAAGLHIVSNFIRETRRIRAVGFHSRVRWWRGGRAHRAAPPYCRWRQQLRPDLFQRRRRYRPQHLE